MDQAYPTPAVPAGVKYFIVSLLGGVLGAGLFASVATTNPKLSKVAGGPTVTQQKVTLEESSAVIDTVKKVSPAVVSVASTRDVQDFFGNVAEQKGGGTGFIITSDGMIVTNRHVVSDQGADYTVVTSDGKNYKAKILALDPVADLAIIKIDASGLPVVDLGNSDDLQIGQFVVAIGNALAEFQNTVTFGVISAKDRQITAGGAGGSERLEGLLQTDAAINPGNSGGPLVNLKGQVIGIDTAVSTDAQNIGFAIPINVVKTAIDSVKKTGKISRPFLGVRYEPITKEVAQLEHLSVDHGALVIRGQGPTDVAVVPGGPADKAGLQENDIITGLNDQEITETQSLARLLQQYHPGDEVTISYLRKGEKQTTKLKLGDAQQ